MNLRCSKLELDWLKLELEACWLIELLCMLDSEQKNTGHEVDISSEIYCFQWMISLCQFAQYELSAETVRKG